MILELGRLALILAGVMGGWAVLTGALALRTARADLAETAWRGVVAATCCAALALLILVGAIIAGDMSVAFVAAQWSVITPLRFLSAAILSAPGGALLAWAVLGGLAGTLVIRSLRADGATLRARAVASIAVGGILAVPLAIVAAMLRPLALHAVATDGVGLSPDLQTGPAMVVAGALCIGLAAASAPVVATIAALAGHHIDAAWSRRLHVWGAVAASAFVVALATSARWHALHSLRGPWLRDPGTVAWLFPAAVAGWMVWLGSRMPTAERTVLRALLAIALFITGVSALALGGGAFVRGVTTAPGTPIAIWLALLPMAAIAATIALVRGGGGALRDAAALPSHMAHPAARIASIAGAVLITGAAAGGYIAREHTVTLADAEIFRARDPFGGQWSFASQGISTLRRDNFASLTVSLLPTRNETRLPVVNVEARSYLLADGTDAAPPAFVSGSRTSPLMELRVAMLRADGEHPTVRISFVPLAGWLAAGAVLLAAGILLSVIPRQRLPQ
jgi:cytochrome c biogenesis factor